MNTLLSLAMFLLVAQTPAPVPRHTPDSPTLSSSKTDDNGQNDKTPTAPLAPVVQPVSGKEHDRGDGKHPDDDPKNYVDVRELPAVTIAPTGFNWANLANYLLVAVGLGGIGVAIWTLCFIRKQVSEMTLQRGVMQSTLEAINNQAVLMDGQMKAAEKSIALFVNTERARLAYTIIAKDVFEYQVTVENIGRSPARLTHSVVRGNGCAHR